MYKRQIHVPVAACVPAHLMGSGLGSSEMMLGDYDIMTQDKDTSYILRLAKKQGITIQAAHREEIDTLAQGKTHGGILAYCGERKYQSIEDIVSKRCV